MASHLITRTTYFHQQRPMTISIARLLVPIAFILSATGSHAATIYFCKGYTGGTFWSDTTCSKQQATIDRMMTVPDNMPFDQQVRLGEEAREAVRRLVEPQSGAQGVTTTTRTVIRNGTTVAGGMDKTTECQALSAHITSLEAMSRQPQSGQRQDWITSEKRKARDRQFQLRC
jgi:hypothetical protein